jgi:asparagine N-glycosylation enzyme membrane subunit Stt3
MRYLFFAGLRRQLYVSSSVAVLAAVGLSSSTYAADPDKAVDAIKTASPIKHVIIGLFKDFLRE